MSTTMTAADLEFNSTRFAELIGVTYRQMDYWARCGAFGDEYRDAGGSGARRRWPVDLLEAGRACGDASRLLSWIGSEKRAPSSDTFTDIVEAVRARPVDLGEFIAISADGVERGFRVCTVIKPHLYVPLVPLDEILQGRAA